MKIAILNTNALLEVSKRGRILGTMFQNAGREWQQKLNVLDQKKKQLDTQLAAVTASTPREQLLKLDRERRALELETQLVRQRSELELNAQRQRAQVQIFDEVGPLLADYCKQHGIDVVFNSPATPMLYASATVDITQDFIEYYNNNAPN